MRADPRGGPQVDARAEVAQRFARISHRVMIAGWVLCVVATAAGLISGVLTSVPRLRDFLADFGVFAPAAYALLTAVQSVFPFLPGGVTVIAAPLLFGPVTGTVSSYVGSCLGSFVVFAMARRVGQPLLVAMFRPRTLRRYLGWLEHRHFAVWFAVAIALPVAPDDLLCYLAGLTPMRARTFVAIIVLLKPWSIMAYSFGVIAVLRHLVPGVGA